ncbi:unnamed protein product [Zymoseptoria tritici ST99CH_1E4]|uniref:Uncharacterized protein n=1 Tax=Zymoseptoria tritici ST99CH_1E4 TaxID=1276532 RepID=A0A2H1FPB9_ZYMTR|nr:unnamed protein product [Zymoseptoria tritici ST99CH_1E4]
MTGAQLARDCRLEMRIGDQIRANHNRLNREAIESANHADRPPSFVPTQMLQPFTFPGNRRFLLPALRLYGHFIDHALPIFHCLLQMAPKLLLRNAASDSRIWIYPEPLLSLTKEQKESTLDYVRRVEEAVDWSIGDPRNTARLGESVEGLTTAQRDRPLLRWGLLGYGSSILINRNMIQAVEDSVRSGDDAAGEMWHSFCLAVLWLHEMSHAVVNAVLPLVDEQREVYLGTTASTDEVGFEVERRIFGGRFQFHKDSILAGKVVLKEWPDRQTLAEYRQLGFSLKTRGSPKALMNDWTVLWRVESAFWQRMFKEEFWLQDSFTLRPEKNIGMAILLKQSDLTIVEEEAMCSKLRSMGYVTKDGMWVRQQSADDVSGTQTAVTSEVVKAEKEDEIA